MSCGKGVAYDMKTRSSPYRHLLPLLLSSMSALVDTTILAKRPVLARHPNLLARPNG